MNGTESERTEITDKFIHKLKCKYNTLKIETIDERLTTVAAHKTMNLLDVNKYKKKNIIVKGDFNIDKIKKLDGVIDIKEENNKYIISIEDDSYTNKIFKEISKYDIKMFSEEDPSLNEIFLSVVGENYE